MLYLKYKLQHNHIPCFRSPSPLSMHASTKDLPSWKVQLKSQCIHSLSKFQGRSPSKALFTWGPFIYRTFCSLKILKHVAAMPITLLAFHLEKLKPMTSAALAVWAQCQCKRSTTKIFSFLLPPLMPGPLLLQSTLTQFLHSQPHFNYHEAQIKFNEQCVAVTI